MAKEKVQEKNPKLPVVKKKCSIKKIAEQYDLDEADYEELLKRIKLDIRRHKKIIKSKKSTKKDVEDSKKKLEGLLCSQAVLKARIYEEAGVSTETIGKPKSASEEQKLINFLLSKAVKGPSQETVKDEAEKKVEKITPLTKADFYKKNTKDQKKDLDEALDKMEEIKKTITQKVIVTPIEKEELKLIKKEIAEVGSVRSSLNDPAVKVVPAIPAKPTVPAKPIIPAKPTIISAAPIVSAAPETVQSKKYSKKKQEVKDLQNQLNNMIKVSYDKEVKLEESYKKLKEDYDRQLSELNQINNQTSNLIQHTFNFEGMIIEFYNIPQIKNIIEKTPAYSYAYDKIIELSNNLGKASEDDIIRIKTDISNINKSLLKKLKNDIDDNILKNKISNFQEELSSIKDTKKYYRGNNDKLLLELQTTKAQLEKTEETLLEIKKTEEIRNQTMVELQDEFVLFSQSKDRLEEIKKQLSNDLIKTTDEKNDLTAKINELNKRLETATTDKGQILLLLENTMKQLEEKNMLYNVLINEKNDITILNDNLTRDFTDTKNKFDNLAKQIEQQNIELGKTLKINEELDKLNKEYLKDIKDKEIKIADKDNAILILENYIGETDGKIDEIKDKLQESNIQVKMYEDNRRLIEQNQKELPEKKKRLLSIDIPEMLKNPGKVKLNKSDLKKLELQTGEVNPYLIKREHRQKIISYNEQNPGKNYFLEEYNEIAKEIENNEKLVKSNDKKLSGIKDSAAKMMDEIQTFEVERDKSYRDIGKLFEENVEIQIDQVNQIEKFDDKIDKVVEKVEEEQEEYIIIDHPDEDIEGDESEEEPEFLEEVDVPDIVKKEPEYPVIIQPQTKATERVIME